MAIGPSTQEKIPRQYRKGRLHGAATITSSAVYLWKIPLASPAVKNGAGPGTNSKVQRIRMLVLKPAAGPLSLCLSGKPRLMPLPVEGRTAHRVHRATMGREGELHRGPEGHRAGYPSEGSCLCCQGTLEGKATFCAQNKKAGIEAGEGH